MVPADQVGAFVKSRTSENPLRVSIIIPAYNAADTLADTLNSILAQTHAHWEATIVDDGSTDSTGKIAQRFVERDDRFKIVRQPNAGEAGARNTGIARARYDWLLFLDADDWISSLYLERMTRELDSDPTLDAVHCRYARVASDGTEVVNPYRPPSGDLFPTLARRAAFPIHACVVRRSFVEQVGRFDRSLQTSPDWDLWQRVARTGACFGAVEEVLAFYRMSPNGASLDAHQLFKDGMRVLRQGHSPDPRVRHPHPDHEKGEPPDQIRTQEFYLLSWCAGLMLGAGRDAWPMVELVKEDCYPELYPDAVAQCIFEAAPLPTCQPPRAWEKFWTELQGRVEDFLVALEKQSLAPELAPRAMKSLKRMVLNSSPIWSLLADPIEGMRAPLEEGRDNWQRLAEEREQAVDEQRKLELRRSQTLLQEERGNWERLAEERRKILEEIQQSHALLEQEKSNWQQLAGERERSIGEQHGIIEQLRENKSLLEQERSGWQRLAEEREKTIGEQTATLRQMEEARARLQEKSGRLEKSTRELRERIEKLSAEGDELRRSYERQIGDLVVNRLKLRGPLQVSERLWAKGHRQVSLAKLAVEGRILGRGHGRYRVLATVCDIFPIYSQTFVYQELTQLARHGFDVRLIYSKLASRDYLSPQFGHLWKAKRRLFLNRKVHEQDFARYRARMPEKIDSLVDKLCGASGLSRQAVLSHDNFLQAFSFTRMVEAYRPEYLHSYFFYDRSLMALVAGYLLNIPRGISCYADHLLRDYELKVVPLHLELCDIVIATSERIKQELLTIAPNTDPGRIIVKPNGIDTECFPLIQRVEPAEGQSFRLVSVCRIEPKKGLIDLVEATSLLRQRGLNVEAHIVGAVDEWSQASREYKAKLDQRISELNLWGKIHLEGRQNLDGVLRFLGLTQLFVAPFVETDSGDKDGIPTALLEAMATGLPVVATDAGSINEVIDNERDGIIVRQRSPMELANAIEALLRNPKRRAQLGQAAVETVHRRYDSRHCEKSFHARVEDICLGPKLVDKSIGTLFGRRVS
jgi:glycosyltransferase involved in cell wall biosynthesis